jgi:hypothetical protein
MNPYFNAGYHSNSRCSRTRSRLNIGPLVRVSAQIPAGQASRVRKQGMHAGLGLRRVEDERCLSVLLQNGVVVVHRNRPVGVPAGRSPYPKDDRVETICQNRRAHDGDGDDDEDSPQLGSEIRGS